MRILSTILLLTLSMSALSADYQSEIDKFFKAYQSGSIDKAVEDLYKTNEYVSSIPDQISKIKTQLNSLSGLVGKINTITKIDTYNVGNSVVHVTYFVTYDRQPVRFEFQYFKVNSGWRIYSFSFDDDVDDEITALARKASLESSK